MKLISKKTLLLFFLPGAVFMGAFLIYPIITMVADSFFDIGLTGDRTFVGLDNYIRVFTAGGFLKQLKNTLLYIVIAVGVETLLGLLFALFFYRYTSTTLLQQSEKATLSSLSQLEVNLTTVLNTVNTVSRNILVSSYFSEEMKLDQISSPD